MGTAAQEDGFCRLVAAELGVVVAAVDYRLAPEHPFPVPLHDCHDTLVWLSELDGVDREQVAIGGRSAGGGLAAALALLACERAQVRPVFQLLTYPMLDDRTAVRDGLDQRHVRLWNNASNHFGWRSYLGAEPGGADVSQLAAPARALDLSGLPPAWIGVGTFDLFADEDIAFAARLQQAGVECHLEVVDGAFHGFDVIHPRAQVSRTFLQQHIDALRGAFRSDRGSESGSTA